MLCQTGPRSWSRPQPSQTRKNPSRDPRVKRTRRTTNSVANRSDNYWFARHSRSIIFLIITLAVLGAYLAFTIPVSVFPSTNFPRVLIGVDNGVMPIDQMMVAITRPIEEAVNSVPGLEEVRSTTSRGSAEINLFFNLNVDMFTTLQYVNAAIARVQPELPPTAIIVPNRLTFASFPIIGYSLTSDTLPQTQLWELATYDIKPRLNRLNGVATVLVQGGQQPEFHVTVDPSKMLRAKVSISDVLGAINHTNIVDSPGLMNRNHQLFLSLVNGPVHNDEDIAGVVVKSVNNVPVRIGDIATVEPAYTVVQAKGKPAVLLSINRQSDSNTVDVANLVRNEIEAIRPSLPAGIEVKPFYDQSNIVNASIRSVRDAIIIGLLLAGFVIWLFLRDWGTAVMTGLVVPVTMFVTFIAMRLLGQSFNLMTLGGLAAAVGLVIDDKIVVVENIVLHRDAGQGPLEATASALKELTVPLIGSTLTPIVVFLPLITITGVTGTFFSALAIAMSVALLTSLVLALVWTSNLSTRLIRRHGAHHEDSEHGFFGHIVRFYERWLRRLLERPLLLGVFCVLLIAVSYVSYRQLGSGLLPAMDEGAFVLDYTMPPGTSLQETNRVLNQVERIIRETPEVETTSRRTGLQLGISPVTEPNTSDFTVKLKNQRKRGIDDVISEIRDKIKKSEPVLDVEFVQLLQDMIGDLSGGAPEPIVVKMFSDDAGALKDWAPQLA